tara:strand:+ start:904 stop:1032 length:129 start_codon:yes stop_codon:yes gene_type:complete
MRPNDLGVTGQTMPVVDKGTKPTFNKPLILIIKEPENVFTLA